MTECDHSCYKLVFQANEAFLMNTLHSLNKGNSDWKEVCKVSVYTNIKLCDNFRGFRNCLYLFKYLFILVIAATFIEPLLSVEPTARIFAGKKKSQTYFQSFFLINLLVHTEHCNAKAR